MSGYVQCHCACCFELTVGEDGDYCHDCEEAGCSEDGAGECQSPYAYGQCPHNHVGQLPDDQGRYCLECGEHE
jgi:hypothetical protein